MQEKLTPLFSKKKVVLLLRRSSLPQHQTGFCSKGRNQMQSGGIDPTGAPAGLAI